MRHARSQTCLCLAVALLGASWAAGAQDAVSGDAGADAPARAAVIRIEGPIGPATSGYFDKAHAQAVADGARLVVLRIDTPGGLDSAMRDIVRLILASPIPVVGHVAPGGARAASAGTYILYAAHVAAMAPATNLGSATPVPVGGSAPSFPSPKPDLTPDEKDDAAPTDDGDATVPGQEGDAMQNKVINDAAAYLRGLAERRGRNADWAEKAVREGANLTASAALEQNVIDIVAADTPSLLAAIHGRSVETAAGAVTLDTEGVTTYEIEPDWRFKLLGVLASPTIAYILLLAGLYGLLLEGYNPGAILPGVVGAICLLLGLFALQMLPVNFVGLGLMLLGIVLLIAEMTVPSFGVLGFGGLVAFVLGSVMLMDSDVPGYAVNLGIVGGIAVFGAGLMGITVYLLMGARRKPAVTGDVRQVGQGVQVIAFEGGRGRARLGGEIWQIESDARLTAGRRARVREVRGLTLVVDPVD